VHKLVLKSTSNPKFLDLGGSARLRLGAMARQAVRLLSTKGLTSEFVDQRSQRWAFPCRFPWTEYGVSNVCRALPTHRSSSTMTPVSAGYGGRQKDPPNFGVCPGQRHRHLAMIKKLRSNETSRMTGDQSSSWSFHRSGSALISDLAAPSPVRLSCVGILAIASRKDTVSLSQGVKKLINLNFVRGFTPARRGPVRVIFILRRKSFYVLIDEGQFDVDVDVEIPRSLY
jgi:hypothetical protein